MKVLFLHGKEGTPTGTKPTYLKRKGHEILAPALDKNDWEASRTAAKEAFAKFKPDVVVGSSRGGALACDLETGDVPKVLIAPAYKHFPARIVDVDSRCWILHCLKDDIVDFEASIQLAESTGATLIECGEGHRMSDPTTLRLLDALLEFALRKHVRKV